MGKPPKKVPKGKDSNQAFALNEMKFAKLHPNDQNKLRFILNFGFKK